MRRISLMHSYLLVLVSLLAITTTTAVKLLPDGSCPIITLIPFTDKRNGPPEAIADIGVEYYGHGQWSNAKALGKAGFSYLAAALMAKDHFNQRDPSIVPALAELGSCTVTFPDNWYIDSAYSRSTTVDSIIALQQNFTDTDLAICAIIGPVEPRANEGASVLAENLDVPQIAYATIDKRLDRVQDFPTFARGLPTAVDYASTIATLMQRDIWIRDFVAIIYDQSDFGEQFEDPLEDAEDILGYTTITEHIEESNPETIQDALGDAQEEGYRTIFLAADQPAILDDVAAVALEKKLLGDKHLWIMTGDVVPPEIFSTLRFQVDSPTDMLLRGAAVVTNYDPFFYEPDNDKFLNSWRSQGDDFLERLRTMHPLKTENDAYFMGESGFFQSTDPTEYASFLYDAIITAGISACRSQQSGAHHVDEVFKSDFQGASGRVLYKDGENGRDVVGVKFGVYNIHPGEIDEATNTRGYTRHLTAIYDGETDAWRKVDDFVYFDGSTNEPMPLRETINWNYLSPSVRTVGFVLMGISLLNISACTAWIFVMRGERIITAAQPQFLYLISFGATLQAVSLLFHSFDESNDWSPAMLNRACAAFPWFFVIGYLIQYCAVFSKLWRLSKLLSLRRRAVHINQVLLPFGLIIASSVILLVVWQIVDPFKWKRELLSTDPELPWVSYGSCDSDVVLPYVIPLVLLFGTIIAMTLGISWKMRDVQSDLSEANWIFIAIFSHLQIWVIGVPVYMILDDVSRDASYLITVALIFIFSNAFICLIMWPKMIAKHFVGDTTKKKATVISVQGQANTHISGLNVHTDSMASNTTGMPSAAGDHYSTSADGDKLKIKELESLVQDLRSKMGGPDPLKMPDVPEESDRIEEALVGNESG